MQNNAITTIENTGIVSTVPSGDQEAPSRQNVGSLFILFKVQFRNISREERRFRSDVRLLVCLIAISGLLFTVGAILILLYFLYAKNYEAIKPAIVAGGVFIGGGVMVMICSVELAHRYLGLSQWLYIFLSFLTHKSQKLILNDDHWG